MSAVAEKTRGRLSRRTDNVRDTIKGEADVIFGGVRSEVDTLKSGVDQLMGLKPVQAVVTVVQGTAKNILGLVGGTVDQASKLVSEQASITREVASR